MKYNVDIYRFICESDKKEYLHYDFDFVFIDGSIGIGDCEEILR